MRFLIVRLRKRQRRKDRVVRHGGRVRGLYAQRRRVRANCRIMSWQNPRADRPIFHRTARDGIPMPTNCSDGSATSSGRSPGTSCPAARDARAGRDSQPAEARESSRHRGAAVRQEAGSRQSRSRAPRRAHGRRHLQRPRVSRRWAAAAAGSAATSRSSTRFPTPPNLMTPSPRARQPRADDARASSSRPRFSTCWPRRGSSSWCTTGSCTSAATTETSSRFRSSPGDDWSDGKMKVPRSVPDPAPAGSTRPPAYANPNSHWWDGSQVYGSDPAVAARLRTGEGGKLKVDATKLLPVDPETGVHLSGFTDNWWIGLAMLHTLFTREHNHICDLLAQGASRLDRRAALRQGEAHQLRADGEDPHRRSGRRRSCPTRSSRSRCTTNWYGLAGDELQEVFEVPRRQRNSRRHRRLEARSSRGAVLADRGVRLGLPHAPAHPRRGGLPIAARPTRVLETIELPDMSGRKTPAS